MKTEVIRLRLTPGMKERVKAVAEADNRTISNWLETIIVKELEKGESKMKTYFYQVTRTNSGITESDGAHFVGTKEEAIRMGANEWSNLSLQDRKNHEVIAAEGTEDSYNELARWDSKLSKRTVQGLTYKNLAFANTASNNEPDYSDLQFIKDGINYFFQNVEAPADWDQESDWTEDEAHVMPAIRDMELYYEDGKGKWFK